MQAKSRAAILFAFCALTSCRQDQAIKAAGDFQQTSDKIAMLSTTMATDAVKSCERISMLSVVRKEFIFSNIQGTPKTAGSCASSEATAPDLQAHLAILATYANQLERLSNIKSVDYNAGAFTTALSNAKIIGVGGKSDADAVTSVVNAIAALITKQASFNIVRDTVVRENGAVQEMALFAEASSVSDWCDVQTAASAGTSIGYCGIYEPEMDALKTTYCDLGQRIFVNVHKCGSSPRVFPTGPDPVTVDSGDACEPDRLRTTLRDGTHLPLQAPPELTPSPAPPEFHRRLSASHAADVLAGARLITDYSNSVATVYNAVRTGWTYGTAVCQFAKAHQRLYDRLSPSRE